MAGKFLLGIMYQGGFIFNNIFMDQKTLKNTEVILSLLQDEVNGDIKNALSKMTDDYSMTWVYQKKDGTLFPKTTNDITKELEDVYPIQGRKYIIKNIAQAKDLVMIEMIESYPDPKTKKVYRTPQVIVLEMKEGKVQTGRHYCDPSISFLHLSEEEVSKAYKKRKKDDLIIS